MNNMEEKLWDYIDGTCSDEERLTIKASIEKDEMWRRAYTDILTINNDISSLTLDEPSMPFAYNVMEGIRAHEASKPLKTSVSKFIIGGIAGFLVLTIVVMLVIAIKGSPAIKGEAVIPSYLPVVSYVINSGVIKIFFYVDIMLLLFLADGYFRRKHDPPAAKSV